MRATICSECRYTNGGAYSVCPICGTEQPEYLRMKQILAKQRDRRGPRNRHPVFRLARRQEAK